MFPKRRNTERLAQRSLPISSRHSYSMMHVRMRRVRVSAVTERSNTTRAT